LRMENRRKNALWTSRMRQRGGKRRSWQVEQKGSEGKKRRGGPERNLKRKIKRERNSNNEHQWGGKKRLREEEGARQVGNARGGSRGFLVSRSGSNGHKREGETESEAAKARRTHT